MSASPSLPPLAILHTESSIGWGGQEIRILTEARGMLDRGHRVMLLTPAQADILPAARRYGIPVEAIDIGKKRPSGLLALRAWLARHGSEYDVVNTHSSTDSWLTALACALLRDPPPIVRTRHVSTPIGANPATRWLYAGATRHIVTTGENLRRQLQRNNGIALDRMTSIRTGIDLDRFRPLDREQQRVRLGVAARPTLGILATLRDWKGHDYLLDAMRLLAPTHPDWQLLVLGDGPQRARLERRVRDEGLANTVHFAGNVDDVPAWLSTLDLFVLPSYGDEGVPQGIMQAMACGLPVVSTPVGAIAEAVQDGETGILVPPRDATALAGALARLMADPALRSSMGEAGMRHARSAFGIDIMLDAMERVFRHHARRGHARPARSA